MNELQETNSPDILGSPKFRNVLLAIIVVLLVVIVVLGAMMIFSHQGKPSQPAVADSTAVDSVVAEAPVSEPAEKPRPVEDAKETLTVTPQPAEPANVQHLATYKRGDVQREYYWDTENQNLCIYDGKGNCLAKHFLENCFNMYGEDGITAKLYNHHVYLVGHVNGCGAAWIIDSIIFYLSPLEDNSLTMLVDGCTPDFQFLENSIRINQPTITNEETASCTAEYEYADHWKTIPLR